MTDSPELAAIRARDAAMKTLDSVPQFHHDRRELLRMLDGALKERDEARAELAQRRESWRCFHCDEVFTDRATAVKHFGESCRDDPACQIDINDVRAMENQLRQYREEGTQLHRELRRMESDHLTALRRAEENGYNKGVQDMTKERDDARAEYQRLATRLNDEAKAEKEHCKDCCCARSWRALGISEYTGKSIPEHIEALRAENERLREAMERGSDG